MPGDRSGHRDLIYSLYEVYEALKIKWNEEENALFRRGSSREKKVYYDISEMCHHVWTQLKEEGYRGVRLDSLYVDETQDFTQAELKILFEVCHNKHDCFFSGDTCQTITSGVGFRFKDLESLFYRSTMPPLTSLLFNYRTHDKILQCAASVVDLLKDFFPQSFDSLPRERGRIEAELSPPILIKEVDLQSAVTFIAGSETKRSEVSNGSTLRVWIVACVLKPYKDYLASMRATH